LQSIAYLINFSLHWLVPASRCACCCNFLRPSGRIFFAFFHHPCAIRLHQAGFGAYQAGMARLSAPLAFAAVVA
jgi:hypothetical protein